MKATPTWKMGTNLFASQRGGRFPGGELGGVRSYPRRSWNRPEAAGAGRKDRVERWGGVSLTCACQPRSPVLHPRPTSTAVTDLRPEAPRMGTRRAHPLGEAARTTQAFLSLGEGRGREKLKHLPFSTTQPMPCISCGFARIQRGDSAGHQTGKGRRWAGSSQSDVSWQIQPYNHQKK